MDRGKLIGLLVLMVLTAPLAGFIWVPILFFGWKYVKFCIKIDLIVIYLLIRLPIWLFIQAPLHVLNVGTDKIEAFFAAGYNKMMRQRKTSVAVLLLTGALFTFLLGPSVNFSSPNLLSIAWWYQTMRSSFIIVSGSVAVTLALLSVKEALSNGISQGEVPGEWARSELRSEDLSERSNQAARRNLEGARSAAESGKKAVEKAGKAKDAFSDISTQGLKQSAKDRVLSADIKNMLTRMAKGFGFEGTEAAAGTAGASILIVTFVFAFVFFAVQLFVVILFFFSYVQFIAPMVLGPIAGALGLGADYGTWIGGEIGDRFLAGMNVNFEDEIAAVMEARQRVFCLLEGPACLRQWQLNNTRTPDSQNVGETYKLQLERFEVGSGDRVNVAYKDGGYRLPISFGLSNTRNGIYGINAYNVSYRIRVIDFGRGDLFGGQMDPYCSTGWRPVDGYSIRESADSSGSVMTGRAVDAPTGAGSTGPDENGGSGSGDREYVGNDLYPGTSASTGFMRLDAITLENCGLLQPGAGQTKTVLLEVKYDYYSEATLYFEAMSRQALQQNPDVSIEWKASETADTPVKSVLNVNSPVLFQEDELGTGDAAVPFDMRASLSADGSDIRYKIENLEIIRSEQVEIADEGSCELRQVEGDDDLLRPAGQAADIIGEGGQNWYSSSNPPPFFGCTMKLRNPGRINPAGQTLSMDVMSNYTVKLNQRLERFRVVNMRCRTLNCPLLVTMQFAEERENPDNWKFRCTGVDAGDGCIVVEGDPDEWSTVKELTADSKLDAKLEEGEIAINPFEWESGAFGTSSYIEELSGPMGKAAIGLTEPIYRRIETADRGFALVSRMKGDEDLIESGGGEREVELVNLGETLCAYGEGDPLDRYRRKTGQEEFLDEESTHILLFRPRLEVCGEGSGDSGPENLPEGEHL